jgi:hypothetical protein
VAETASHLSVLAELGEFAPTEQIQKGEPALLKRPKQDEPQKRKVKTPTRKTDVWGTHNRSRLYDRATRHPPTLMRQFSMSCYLKEPEQSYQNDNNADHPRSDQVSLSQYCKARLFRAKVI